MPEPTPEAWAQMRHDYEHTDRPVADICAQYGTTPNTLRDRVRRWGWTPRRAPIPAEGPPPSHAPLPAPLIDIAAPPLAAAPPLEAAAPPLLAAPESEVGGTPAETDPAAIAPRLQGAVARVLPAIEATLAKLAAAPMRPREMEQAARALGSLTRTLRELNALLVQQPNGKICDCEDMPEDIDEFRNELARRIEAFVASRTSGADQAAEQLPAPAAPPEPLPCSLRAAIQDTSTWRPTPARGRDV